MLSISDRLSLKKCGEHDEISRRWMSKQKPWVVVVVGAGGDDDDDET